MRLAASLAAGEVSAARAVEATLERIAAVDPRLGAYVTVTADAARAAAERADAALAEGRLLGPLHGLPVAVKDNVAVAGVRTTNGSSFLAEHVPARDADVVSRLADAGAIVLGTLTMHELAYGATSQNPHTGPCRNPWDLTRIPGGSSGGSGAAVAAGLCAAALGTDTGGSVRIPAALCGVSALRPSRGRVSTRGVFPITWSFDTVGPIARSAAELALLFAVLRDEPLPGDEPLSGDGAAAAAGADAGAAAAAGEGLAGVRIGVPRDYFFDDVDADIVSAVRDAAEVFARGGAQVEEIDLPGAAAALESCTAIIRSEAYAIHGRRLAADPEAFGEDVRRRLPLGRDVTPADFRLHRRAGRAWRSTLAGTFSSVDLVLSPTTGTVAPPIGLDSIETTHRLVRLTYGWSFAGIPALSVPCGFARGLPVGLQLAAAHGREGSLLRAGAAYQRLTDWHLRQPPLAAH